MELQVQILEILPVERRPFTKQDGTPSEFISRGFRLTNGISTFYAEVTGEQAMQDTSSLVLAQWRTARLTFRVRMYNDRDNNKRYANYIELNGLSGMLYR